MFDGSQFLTVAQHSVDDHAPEPTSDARFRTGVGRAYYACFHVLRRSLCDPRGWTRIEKGGRKKYLTHHQLRGLIARKLPPGSTDLFDSLIEMREHADYHTWKPSVGRSDPPPSCQCSQWDDDPRTNCVVAVRTAEELIKQIPKSTLDRYAGPT